MVGQTLQHPDQCGVHSPTPATDAEASPDKLQNTTAEAEPGSPRSTPGITVTLVPGNSHLTRDAPTTTSTTFRHVLYRVGRSIFFGTLTIVRKASGRLLKLCVTSSIIFWATCVAAGLLVWRYKVIILLVIYRIGVKSIDGMFLVPLCQSNYSIQSKMCDSICTVAHAQGMQFGACLHHDLWVATSVLQPVQLSRQVKFSKLAFDDLRNQSQALEFAFDKIPEALDQASRHCMTVESSLEQYSREVGIMFELSSIGGKQAERGVWDSASEDGSSLLLRWLTGAVKNPQTAALDAYIKTLQPKLQDVLTIGSHIRDELTILGTHEMQIANQIKSAEKTLSKHRPRFSFTRKPSNNLDFVERSINTIKALAIGLEKVTDASTSTSRSFQGSLKWLVDLNNTLGYHTTWQGPLKEKPGKVYLTQIESAVQQARREFQSWGHEDSRHEKFLFGFPAERVAELYQPYASEVTR